GVVSSDELRLMTAVAARRRRRAAAIRKGDPWLGGEVVIHGSDALVDVLTKRLQTAGHRLRQLAGIEHHDLMGNAIGVHLLYDKAKVRVAARRVLQTIPIATRRPSSETAGRRCVANSKTSAPSPTMVT